MTPPDSPSPSDPNASTVDAPAGYAPAAFSPYPTTGPYEPLGEVGQVVAERYKLIEVIGEGGMGSVWLARQTEPVSRLVAIKFIKAGMDSKAVLARFDAERQALALMDHTNIAKILDGGLDVNRPFFVMEFVKGVPITKFCDERKFTPKQRLELFVLVCNAIQHAHQKGVIHRDIKPGNVLVTMSDDKPVPKVIDFGVAKAAGAPLTDHTLVTGFAVLGTPEYMSPEQASLTRMDVDTRSDVYALGVLLYELLTGSTPVDRKGLGGVALLEVLRVVREVEAPRPSARLRTCDALATISADRGIEPKRLIGLLRNELDWIVMKALEKDRARRYDSASQLAADVENFLQEKPIQAARPNRWYAARKFLRRNRSLVWAAVLVLAMLAAFWGVQRRSDHRHRETLARSTLQRYLEADIERLPVLLKEMQPLRSEIEPLLFDRARDPASPPARRLHTDLALVGADPGAADRLEHHVLLAEPREAIAIGLILAEHPQDWGDRLWPRLDAQAETAPEQRVRVAAVLAQLDPGSPRWGAVADALVDALLAENSLRAGEWAAALRPVMPRLHGALAAALDTQKSTPERALLAARILSVTAHDPRDLARWLVDCDEQAFVTLFPASASPFRAQEKYFFDTATADKSPQKRLNACAALLRSDPKADVGSLLRSGPNLELRTALIHKFHRLGVPATTVVARIFANPEPAVQSAWIQALGSYPVTEVPASAREAALRHCEGQYPEQDDPELRASQEWLLRQWGRKDVLTAAEKKLEDKDVRHRRWERVSASLGAAHKVPPQWFATPEGQVMIALVRPAEFVCGLRESDRDRFPKAGSALTMRISRSYAIGAKPITAEEFRRYLATFEQVPFKIDPHFCKERDCPVLGLNWEDAAGYCNWRSQQEGFEPAYERDVKTGRFVPKPNALKCLGYRLPTEGEWEYACRGGTTTPWFYGTPDYAKHYGAFAERRSNSVGVTKPNPFGLFDLHGNVFNWCHDNVKDVVSRASNLPVIDDGGHLAPAPGAHRILRGGSYLTIMEIARSDLRSWAPADERYITYGFRVARTLAVHEYAPAHELGRIRPRAGARTV